MKQLLMVRGALDWTDRLAPAVRLLQTGVGWLAREPAGILRAAMPRRPAQATHCVEPLEPRQMLAGDLGQLGIRAGVGRPAVHPAERIPAAAPCVALWVGRRPAM